MGMGQAMCEETRYLEGLPAHASLLEYRMPTIAESPPIEVQIVESHDPYGPFGAKEASEGALAGFPPAVVNAIANAIGIDLNELPVTPDRVMEALIERRRTGEARQRIEGRIMTAPLAEFPSGPAGHRQRGDCGAVSSIRAAASSRAAPTSS